MERKILAITLALSIGILGSANIGYAKENLFPDVTEAVSYHEDIQILNEMGILFGYGDGKFYPDNAISVAEGITLAERAFGEAQTLPTEWKSWFEPQCGWTDNINIDKYLFRGDFSKNMSYETAAEVVLKLNNLRNIDTSLWNIHSTSYDKFLNTLYVRGYDGNHETIPYSAGNITRGEFCHMIVYMLGYDGTYTIPTNEEIDIPVSVYMPKQLTDSNAYVLDAKSYISHVPERVRASFANDGFEVVIVPYSEWFNLFPGKNEYTGFYYHSSKKVYIRSDYENSVVHELGHYLENKLSETGYDISTADSIKCQLGLFRRGKYYMKNDSEFFAEAFNMYCTIPQQLHKITPEVYTFMDKAVSAFDEVIK